MTTVPQIATATTALYILYDGHSVDGIVDRLFTIEKGKDPVRQPITWGAQRNWESYYKADAEAAVNELPVTVRQLLSSDTLKFTMVITLPQVVFDITSYLARIGHMEKRVTSPVNAIYPQPIRSAYVRWAQSMADLEIFKRKEPPNVLRMAGTTNTREKIMLVSPVHPMEALKNGSGKRIFGGKKSIRTEIYRLILAQMARLKSDQFEALVKNDRGARLADFAKLGITETKDGIEWEPQGEFAVNLKRLVALNGGERSFYSSIGNRSLPVEITAHNMMAAQGKINDRGNIMLAAFPSVSRRVEAFHQAYSLPMDKDAIKLARKNGAQYVMDFDFGDPVLQRDPYRQVLNPPPKFALL